MSESPFVIFPPVAAIALGIPIEIYIEEARRQTEKFIQSKEKPPKYNGKKNSAKRSRTFPEVIHNNT